MTTETSPTTGADQTPGAAGPPQETAPEEDTPRRPPRTSMGTHLRTGALVVLGFALTIALWQAIITIRDVPAYVVPPPGSVWDSLRNDFDTLWRNTKPTAIESVGGFVIGSLAAIVLAVIFVHSPIMRRMFLPVVIVIRTIPVVAIAPVLVLMLGNGLAPKIVIAALISFFPTLVNMVEGLESVDSQSLELFRVLSASNWEIFWKLRIFKSLPFLFASLKIASTASVIGAVVAEWIGSDEGLGALIILATFNFRASLLYATMIFASILALGLFAAISLLERLVVRWQPE